jgi:hypothetical protein
LGFAQSSCGRCPIDIELTLQLPAHRDLSSRLTSDLLLEVVDAWVVEQVVNIEVPRRLDHVDGYR